jgi:hypothetical protein
VVHELTFPERISSPIIRHAAVRMVFWKRGEGIVKEVMMGFVRCRGSWESHENILKGVHLAGMNDKWWWWPGFGNIRHCVTSVLNAIRHIQSPCNRHCNPLGSYVCIPGQGKKQNIPRIRSKQISIRLQIETTFPQKVDQSTMNIQVNLHHISTPNTENAIPTRNTSAK